MNFVHDLTDEQTVLVLEKLAEVLKMDDIIKECTPRGKGDAVKTNKPKNNVMAYVWRMARFHNGADSTMPVSATFDLGRGIRELTGIPLCISLIRPNIKIVLDFCDSKAEELVKATGGDPDAAAKRWGKALGYF